MVIYIYRLFVLTAHSVDRNSTLIENSVMNCEKLKCFYGCGKSFSASEIKNHHQNECSLKLEKRDSSSVCSNDSKEPDELNFKRCPKCLRYVEKSRFQNHLNEHDNASKSCKYCGKEIPCTMYKRHVEFCKEKRNYAGENVAEVVNDISALCPLCNELYPYTTILDHGIICIKKYVKSAHLYCPICEKKYHVADIDGHISQCRKKELFTLNCLTCDKQLSSRESAQHIAKCKAESDEMKFLCRVCKEQLEVPLLNLHFDSCMQKSKLRTKLTCVLCSKKFKTDSIHGHTILCCHDVMKSIKVTCPVCEEQFLANKFDDHIPCQQKKSCPWCEVKYPDAEFMNHVEQCDKKQIECIICNKAVPFSERRAHQEECSRNKSASNLLPDLLPLSVQQAVQAFEVRKTDLINDEKAKIGSQTQFLNGILASLNLPAALEDTTGVTLPPSLQQKAQAVRNKGGIDALQKAIDELPNLLQRNKELLEESDRMLKDEEESDNKLCNEFGAQWTCTPSTKFNKSLKEKIQKYRDIVTQVRNADNVVKEKLSKNSDKISLLCLPENELLSQISKGMPIEQSSATVQLKNLMEQVKILLAERNTFKDDLEGVTTDMRMKFLSALSNEDPITEQAFSMEKLEEIYGPIQKKIKENLERQDKLIAEIQTVNNEFCKEKHSNQNATARETMFNDLAAAYDIYMEIMENINEGTKFYNNFTEILVSFQSKIKDFCFARKTERELCKKYCD